jgi:hypothetical protein
VGLPEATIKSMGRWRSNAFQRYIDVDVTIHLQAVSNLFVLGARGMGGGSQGLGPWNPGPPHHSIPAASWC